MLRRKALRDIKANLSSFITIFIMTFLGVFVFSGIHAYMDGMKYSGDSYYEENHLQDLWVMGESLTDEDFETVKSIDGVENAERALVINCDLQEYEDVVIETSFIESNEISKMYIVDGEDYDPSKEGFWLDSYLAKNLGIKTGDTITLSYSGYELSGKILGLVNTPDHVYAIKDSSAIFPTHKDYGYAYTSITSLPEDLIKDMVTEEIQSSLGGSNGFSDFIAKAALKDFDASDYYFFTNFYVTLKDDADIEAVKALIQAKVKNATAVVDRDANTSAAAYQSEVDEGKSYSVIFTALFLFIAILSVVTTMQRFVKKQRTQIGTLKALGISQGRIVRHYISFGLYISLAAAALGILLGALLIGNLFVNMEASYFEVPNMHITILPIVYVVTIGVVILITLVTYLSCRRILKEPASEALRTEVPKVKAGSLKSSGGFFGKMSIGVRWNVRDVRRNKGRTITAIAGIVGCTMLVVCAFGMRATMQHFIDWQFNGLYNFKYKLELQSGLSDKEIQELEDTYGTATSQSLAVEAIDKDGTKSTREVLITDAGDSLRFSGHSGSYITLSDDGIYETEKLRNILGLDVGDEAAWSIYGDDTSYTTTIAGTNRSPQGQSFSMTRAYAESLGLDYQPDSIYTDVDLDGVKNIEGVALIQDKESLKEGTMSMINLMNMMVVLLIVVSLVLAFVIIYNLGILSFTEKQYQFATLKVLGFKSSQIKKIYIMQNNWISAAAILLGLPMGFFMTSMIFKAALGNNYDMMVTIPFYIFIISGIGTFAAAYLINLFLARKVKTIDMVSSLKANE